MLNFGYRFVLTIPPFFIITLNMFLKNQSKRERNFRNKNLIGFESMFALQKQFRMMIRWEAEILATLLSPFYSEKTKQDFSTSSCLKNH